MNKTELRKPISNIVNSKVLKEIQSRTLNLIADTLKKSAGPYGSTTVILSNSEFPRYTKDGHTIMKNIKFDSVIEQSIKDQLSEITRYIVKEVGDGTTSAILISNALFDTLNRLGVEKGYMPFQIINALDEVVNELKGKLQKIARPLKLEDVYNIAMISTNSNEQASKQIENIYNEYGLDVEITLGTSTNHTSYVKVYDGMKLNDAGYMSRAYITEKDPVPCAKINRPFVYAFQDDVDNVEMSMIFEKIISENILNHINKFIETKDNSYLNEVRSTVIIVPRITRDVAHLCEYIDQLMYRFDEMNLTKPPILIIDSTGSSSAAYDDLIKMLGCKYIKKYIDPKAKELDEKNGIAITLDNVIDNAPGYADMAIATSDNTIFINPDKMYCRDDIGNIEYDENGNPEYTQNAKDLMAYLQNEIDIKSRENADLVTISLLKKRLSSLKSNSVEYFVGGINTTDRDALKDLLEDAVKNIASANMHGVSYGSNINPFLLLNDQVNIKGFDTSNIKNIIKNALFSTYCDIINLLLLSSGIDCKESNRVIQMIVDERKPYNLVTGTISDTVLSSIRGDIAILEAVTKIIGMMYTTNQALVQEPLDNVYDPRNEIN